MEHSIKFYDIQKYYNTFKSDGKTRLWSINAVKNAVIKGWITAEEYEEITARSFDGSSN